MHPLLYIQAKRGNNLPDLSWELGHADEPEGELDE